MICPRCRSITLAGQSPWWGDRLVCAGCGHSVDLGATLTQQQAEAETERSKGAGKGRGSRSPSTGGVLL